MKTDDKIYEKLEKILVQTTKTNGRLDRAEDDIKDNKSEIKVLTKKTYMAMGGITIL